MGLVLHVQALRTQVFGTGLTVVFFVWTFISLFYLKADVVVGLLAWLMGVGLYIIASRNFMAEDMFYTCLGLHLFGWITQIVGHGIYEKRAPAITTNLLFLFIAPFFVIIEILQWFGFR